MLFTEYFRLRACNTNKPLLKYQHSFTEIAVIIRADKVTAEYLLRVIGKLLCSNIDEVTLLFILLQSEVTFLEHEIDS